MNYQKLPPSMAVGNELLYRITAQYVSIVDLEGGECIILDHTQFEQLAAAVTEYKALKERYVGLQFEQDEFEHHVP